MIYIVTILLIYFIFVSPFLVFKKTQWSIYFFYLPLILYFSTYFYFNSKVEIKQDGYLYLGMSLVIVSLLVGYLWWLNKKQIKKYDLWSHANNPTYLYNFPIGNILGLNKKEGKITYEKRYGLKPIQKIHPQPIELFYFLKVIPRGIYFTRDKRYVQVSFPRLWKREIERLYAKESEVLDQNKSEMTK